MLPTTLPIATAAGVTYPAHFGYGFHFGAIITKPQIAPAAAPPRCPPMEMPGIAKVMNRLSSSVVPIPVLNTLTP